jgi:hypothetical protein
MLLTHPAVKDAGVVGVPDEVAGELPIAIIVKQPGATLTEEEIIKYAAGQVYLEFNKSSSLTASAVAYRHRHRHRRHHHHHHPHHHHQPPPTPLLLLLLIDPSVLTTLSRGPYQYYLPGQEDLELLLVHITVLVTEISLQFHRCFILCNYFPSSVKDVVTWLLARRIVSCRRGYASKHTHSLITEIKP